MPRASWNEIEARAIEFASRWEGETYERGESQSFWSEFLDIFEINRRRHGAFFEYAIKKGNGKQGFIDLFWPGKLLAEQKSGGKDRAKARLQAYDYLATLPDRELPQRIVVSDFATFDLVDITVSPNTIDSFALADLPRHIRRFAFLIDEASIAYEEEHPVNQKAAETMAALHNQLAESRYTGRDLELLLVRLVFCYFADDTGIFERKAFANYLTNRTQPDGSDLGPRLVKIFEVLNTPPDARQTTLDADLAALPYINGGLFADPIRTPDFTSAMRHDLRTATLLDWGKVSPAIFGSMFQGVMDPATRRNLGAHYTSERNILRVITPLFMDDLYAEFARVAERPSQLKRFHAKLATLNFLDPACGSGNFLVITYRELRRLEHKVVKLLQKGQMSLFNVRDELHVNVDQMHGIEIEEFPALIAQTALWLTDHQMNLEASRELGQHYVRLPLEASANIVHANALTTDWSTVVEPAKLTYILGNPPFVGKQYQTREQKTELSAVFGKIPGVGELDFVTGWYAKTADLIAMYPTIRAALVSTNSITQGEQPGILWTYLLDRNIQIDFAHQTFKWTNDARGVAAVFCVIVGLGSADTPPRRLFAYPDIRGEPIEQTVEQINPYLVAAPTVLIHSRRAPLSPDTFPMRYGSKPVDNGNYMFTASEQAAFVADEPGARPFIRPLLGSQELINGIERWCLWLQDADPSTLRGLAKVRERIERVREFRLASRKEPTRRAAQTPQLFMEQRQPSTNYLAVPEVSSERRDYIPIAYVSGEVIANNLLYTIATPDRYLLGVLLSNMHMAWVRVVAGRLEGRCRYSSGLVYNNFPWPDNLTDAQTAQIERLAQAVLDARAEFPESTLADLYDPLTMPPSLAKAHAALDRAVDHLYRKDPFDTDSARVAHLFERYQALTANQ